MKVKDLKKYLEDVDDNMVVVTSGWDHQYFPIDIGGTVSAEFTDLGQYFEYYDPDGNGTTVVEVLLLE